MENNFKQKSLNEVYQEQAQRIADKEIANLWGKSLSAANVVFKDVDGLNDIRYKTPKGPPKADLENIEMTIAKNGIYSQMRDALVKSFDDRMMNRIMKIELDAQRKQVGYGIDKYPETLNPNSWSAVETIDHIIDETIDKLHYLVMLRIKLEDEEENRSLDPAEDEDDLLSKSELEHLSGILTPGGISVGYNFKDDNDYVSEKDRELIKNANNTYKRLSERGRQDG